jgi:hypothetical protein
LPRFFPTVSTATMGDKLTDEHLKRLNDLAALRDRGVLSEQEFQRAKRRLLGEAPAVAPGGSGAGFGLMQGRMRWVTIGAGVLLLILLLWLLLGRREPDEGTDIIIENGTVANGSVSAADGELLCASQAVHARLKDFIFAQAMGQHRGDPAPLASLQGTIGVRMEYPLFRSATQDGQRLSCSGHLILDLPPTVRPAFAGAAALESDVNYTLQPEGEAARVIDAAGAAYTVQILVAAAVTANEAQSAKAQAAANPSFDCGDQLSNVERMICRDEDLARLDREVSGRYGRVSEGLPEGDLSRLEESQRSFLQRRNECPDIACVKSAYDRQLGVIRDFEGSVGASNPL